MKELLMNIITKIISHSKYFIRKVEYNINFEGNKSTVIKVMYNSVLESREKEIKKLSMELESIKKENDKLVKQINYIKVENKNYSQKIDAINSFQDFLLGNL